MKYKGREIEKGEKIVILSGQNDDSTNIIAIYTHDEKIEVTVPIFKYDEEEVRGIDCWWVPLKELEGIERDKEEENYDNRTLKFNEKRGTSKT